MPIYAQGRLDEAFELTHEAEREVDADDLLAAIRLARRTRRHPRPPRLPWTEAKRLTAEALALRREDRLAATIKPMP